MVAIALQVLPSHSLLYGKDGELANSVFAGQFPLAQFARAYVLNSDFSKGGPWVTLAFWRYMQSVLNGMLDILRARDVLQIVDLVVCWVAIKMIDFFSFRTRAYKSEAHQPVDILIIEPVRPAPEIHNQATSLNLHGFKDFPNMSVTASLEPLHLPSIRYSVISGAERDRFPLFNEHNGIIPCHQQLL